MQNSNRRIWVLRRISDKRVYRYKVESYTEATGFDPANIPADYEEVIIPASSDGVFIDQHRKSFLFDDVNTESSTPSSPTGYTYSETSGIQLA